MNVLELAGVGKRFGALAALSNIGFSVEEGAIFGIIGPNGAGKSTLFNLLTAIYRFDEGTISIGGVSIAGLGTQRIARLGVARTFQNLRLFGNASALANVMVGEHVLLEANVFDSLFNT
ncbi:MAG: ATP-binding cassette domain-containing protein, partial [Candidatus Eremiobacteraeota bacterium]|nr:ATP-binding cassette domain-containing protein [Candidatus Eremiobacteraeota bacterium]